MEEVKERKKEMKKEGKKERRKRKEGKKRGWPALSPAAAGGGRRWPKVAGGERSKPQAQAILWGTSVVQKEKLEFWKWCFEERSYSSLE